MVKTHWTTMMSNFPSKLKEKKLIQKKNGGMIQKPPKRRVSEKTHCHKFIDIVLTGACAEGAPVITAPPPCNCSPANWLCIC